MNLKSIFSKNSLSPDKKNQLLMSILVIVVFVTLIVLYFGFWRSTPVSEDMNVPGAPVETGNENIRLEKVIEKINFDVSFLKTSRFQDLSVYGEWPLKMGEKGRQNPFLPYGQ